MNKQQFSAFRKRAHNLWVHMETYRLAYAKSADEFAKRSEKLKWTTIVVGFLTGVFSVPVFLQISATEYIVAIFGVLTGTLTVVDKHFRWEEISAEAWVNQKNLDRFQRELYDFALDVGSSVNDEEPSLFIQRLHDRSEKHTETRIENIAHWSAQANLALQSHGIARLEFVGPTETVEEAEAFPDDDAQGIVAVSRG